VVKRLLILSASAGAGHNRAASAIKASADLYFPEIYTEWHDALDYTPRAFKKLYDESYKIMAGRVPSIWELLYDHAGKEKEKKLFDKLMRSYDRSSYRTLVNFVEKFKADFILCTHFFPSNVLLAHKNKHIPPIGITITDYDVHKFWVNSEISQFFISCDEVKYQMLKMGISGEKITITGIPIHPVFSTKKDRKELTKGLGLDPTLTTVLIISSGFAGGNLARVLESILSISGDFQVIAISGKNERLRRQLCCIGEKCKRVKVYGFVKNMEDFMEVADIAITKAGGLTTSECLAKGLPMIIFSPIPGQEEHNCDYLVSKGAATKAENIELLDFKLAELLKDRIKLQDMKSNAQKLAKPQAARDIIKNIRF
jgi:processive 1,2-diacylglycerol beta-glucosyltransferase